MSRVARAALVTVLLLHAGAAVAGPLLYLPLDAAWRIETKGSWQARMDPRDLLAMRHPWQPSVEGAFAQATRTVKVPEDWTGPVQLDFYCSDNYHTDASRPDGGPLTAEGFIGHRLKQVFVNQRIVWSSDVADPVVQGDSPRYRIPLDVKPGEQFQLGLVVFDVTSSTTVLSQDFFQSAQASQDREGTPEAFHFHTDLYWGDLILLSGDAQTPEGRRPVEAKVLERHEKQGIPPITADTDALKTSVRLDIHHFQEPPAGGFPIRMGLPFPPGKVTDIDAFRITTNDAKALPSARQPLAWWPDDSLRWCLVDLLVLPDMDTLELEYKKDTAKISRTARLKTLDETLQADSGRFTFHASPGRLLHDFEMDGKSLVEELTLSGLRGGERLNGTATAVHVVEETSFRLELMAEGRLQGSGSAPAAFRCYLTTWAGQPYLQLILRVVNDGDADLPLSELSLALQLAGPAPQSNLPEARVEGDFEVTQASPQQRTLNARNLLPASEGEVVAAGVEGHNLSPTAPFWASMGPVHIALPRMRELFPKGFRRTGDQCTLRLIDAPASPVVYTPGEASTHEVWLAFGEVDTATFSANAERPPVLSNPVYFAASGAYGPAHPVIGIVKYDEGMARHYQGRDWEALGHRYGVRTFPDSPYFASPSHWSNNYYNRTHGAWAAWLATGDAEWRQRAVELCRHIHDVAIVHSPVPGKDWLGALHGPGANHVPGPWSPTLRTRGLWLYHVLTGAPESEQAFLGVADFVQRSEAHRQSPSVRDHAGPMDAIVTAYDATREPAWLDEGSKRVSWAWERMDRRRGVWPETHGSMVYRGNVPWMVAQLAGPLYEWYLLTGDVEAAQLVTAMAESMILENTAWDAPGTMSGYSHNPHFSITAAYDPLILPVLFAAYELSGEQRFLDAALAQWRRWEVDEVFDSVFNTFWNTPWLGYYLNRHKPGVFEAALPDEAAAP
ncbi:MAG: hypothetical protein RLZZ303_3255 [Candidatus Hydrogenedentota bacterium]